VIGTILDVRDIDEDDVELVLLVGEETLERKASVNLREWATACRDARTPVELLVVTGRVKNISLAPEGRP
jgi:hypothetical protein